MTMMKFTIILFFIACSTSSFSKCITDIAKIKFSIQSHLYEFKEIGVNVELPSSSAYSFGGEWISFCPDINTEFKLGFDFTSISLDTFKSGSNINELDSYKLLDLYIRATRVFPRIKNIEGLFELSRVEFPDIVKNNFTFESQNVANYALGFGLGKNLLTKRLFSLDISAIHSILLPNKAEGFGRGSRTSLELDFIYKLLRYKSIELSGIYQNRTQLIYKSSSQDYGKGDSSHFILQAGYLFRF